VDWRLHTIVRKVTSQASNGEPGYISVDINENAVLIVRLNNVKYTQISKIRFKNFIMRWGGQYVGENRVWNVEAGLLALDRQQAEGRDVTSPLSQSIGQAGNRAAVTGCHKCLPL